jgi:DNA polymerase I
MNEQLPIIGYDTETHRFGPGLLIPPLVCVQVSCGEARQVVSTGDGDELMGVLDFLFPEEGAEHRIVAHNMAYDLASVCGHSPDMLPRVFKALEDGRCHDTKIREKLLNLTTHGKLDVATLPDGSGGVKLSYSLADLVQKYLGIDISESKVQTEGGKVVKGEEDSWRINFDALDGTPTSEWPQEAHDYAMDDAVYAEQIYWKQEEKRQEVISERGFDPFEVESFRVAVDFCLYLMSAWGMAVDPEEHGRIRKMLEQELAPENMPLLIESGILIPGRPPEPYKNKAKDHRPDCNNKKTCDCPLKMKAEVPEKIAQAKLRAFVEEFCKRNGLPIERTSPSDKFPEGQISIKAEWFEDYQHLDPLFDEYVRRQKLQKLVTTELPRMEWPKGSGDAASVVHPCYDILKETGRTSSYGSDAYPSFNCQNVDPRARGCYIARPGTVLFSCDYSQMELGTLGQTCLKQFGYSVLADKINGGIDPHAYLGAQICYRSHDGFAGACAEDGAADADAIYERFAQMKGCGIEDVEKMFKHYRTLAKPTGLGYPGGLGPKTFVQYAKANYGVEIDIDTATELREAWFETYPEMREYFQWINNMLVDPWNPPRIYTDKQTGEQKEIQQFAYRTPMGMWRVGCDYCACANGVGLQSPSAEGALLAVFNVVRACYDPAMQSILYGRVRPICFVHDEIIGEVDEMEDRLDLRQACLDEVSRIMVESFRQITPDVAVKAQPVLMRKWVKDLDPVFDDLGRLVA